MKNVILLLSLLELLLFISCSEERNPVSNEEHPILIHHSSYSTFEFQFEDTCSYNFVISFFEQFDSVQVQAAYLGGYFYVYADSGDYNYWYDYFDDDSTIQSIYVENSVSDSLLLKLCLTGKKSSDQQRSELLNTKHLQIINFEESPKLIYLHFSPSIEHNYEEIFSKYKFIININLIVAVTES